MDNSEDRAHGRIERRGVKVVTVAGILFPHARQALQITRKTRRLDSTKWTTEIAYYPPGARSSVAKVFSLAAHDANRARLSAASPSAGVV